jgi:TetR/AcrR family transcriptional repressor of nem operon
MPRPREFDETTVLDAALAVFWAKGFDATSIDDLVAATGLGRASLYGAFGDKERFFARVVDHYLEKTAALDRVDEDRPPREALVELTNRWLTAACAEGPGGCFLQQSCMVASSAQVVTGLVERIGRAREDLLARIITRGQKSGDLPAVARPIDLARFLLIVQQGIAVAARAGASKRELAVTLRLARDRVLGDRAR